MWINTIFENTENIKIVKNMANYWETGPKKAKQGQIWKIESTLSLQNCLYEAPNTMPPK